ncbi:MAG: YbjQ family protein [Bacteroidaceae bacterium]|nr:YbjQ family protein [Bacteroidaceae bacterium]
MDTIKLFNTPTVEGYKIESYLGLVTANQVAGTGFMTDFVASFSDFFGGNSGAYREEMNNLFENVKENLQAQAAELGGNAIIGVKVDYDSISAKNMSMLMVSMQGTVVKLKTTDEGQEISEAPKGFIAGDILTLEYNKRLYSRILRNGSNLNEDAWKYITSHNMPELAEPLYFAYLRAKKDPVPLGSVLILNNFPKYVYKLSYSEAVNLLYGKEDCLVDLIIDLHLFSAKHILEYLKQGQLNLVFQLLKSDKRSYSKTDLEEMKELAQNLQNLPDKGKLEEIKGGVFSSGGIKFVCECGCKNDKDTEYCSSCGKNIKGITKTQNYSIKAFIEKIEILEKLLNNSAS